MKRLVSLFVQALNGYLLVASLLVSCTHIQLPYELHPEAEFAPSTTLGAQSSKTAQLPPVDKTLPTPKSQLQLAPSQVQYGVASWYGRPFHGRRTANGEVYNMYEVSAAHRTAPLGTYAVVTNLNNGQSVQVRINDRGPMKRYRIVDLSYKAAQEIGMVATGTTRVKVEFLTSAMPSGTSQTAHLVSWPTHSEPMVSPEQDSGRTLPVSSPVRRRGSMARRSQDVAQVQLAQATGPAYFQVATLRDSAPPWYRGSLGPSLNRVDSEPNTPQNVPQEYVPTVIQVVR